MAVPEQTIAAVVAEASERMHDPQFISSRVDLFMGAQPMASQYVLSHADELEVEGVVTVLFHAALIGESAARAGGRTLEPVSIEALDAAARAAPTPEQLAEREPDLAAYIASNVELERSTQLARELLSHLALALVDSGR